nr:hypothetical protein [Gammaproteobacteria bacterium]
MADILNPRDYYESVLKDKVNQEADNYFEELVTKSGIDKDANISTIKNLRKKELEYKNLNKELNKLKTKKTVAIVFSILSLAGAVISLCFVITAEKKALPIILMIVLLILGIGLILLITL